MKDISPEQMVIGDKSGIDLSESRPSLQALLKEHRQHLEALPPDAPAIERARIQLDIAEALLALQQKPEAWSVAAILRAAETCLKAARVQSAAHCLLGVRRSPSTGS